MVCAMPNSYDVALRKRAVMAYERGAGSYAQLAALFEVEADVGAVGGVLAHSPAFRAGVAILHDVQRLGDGTGQVFPNPRGKPLFDATLSQLIKEFGIAVVPHGFRSSFRDWWAEQTSMPREMVEAALAHTVQNPTEAAYARSDLFERRRRLMDDWASAIETM